MIAEVFLPGTYNYLLMQLQFIKTQSEDIKALRKLFLHENNITITKQKSRHDIIGLLTL